MKFYLTEWIGPKQSQTPEGLLSCKDVPIARRDGGAVGKDTVAGYGTG
jgi:hypothetical protein